MQKLAAEIVLQGYRVSHRPSHTQVTAFKAGISLLMDEERRLLRHLNCRLHLPKYEAKIQPPGSSAKEAFCGGEILA